MVDEYFSLLGLIYEGQVKYNVENVTIKCNGYHYYELVNADILCGDLINMIAIIRDYADIKNVNINDLIDHAKIKYHNETKSLIISLYASNIR